MSLFSIFAWSLLLQKKLLLENEKYMYYLNKWCMNFGRPFFIILLNFATFLSLLCMCLCVCVRVCVRACVRACMRVWCYFYAHPVSLQTLTTFFTIKLLSDYLSTIFMFFISDTCPLMPNTTKTCPVRKYDYH